LGLGFVFWGVGLAGWFGVLVFRLLVLVFFWGAGLAGPVFGFGFCFTVALV